jgi:hypothetical protein
MTTSRRLLDLVILLAVVFGVVYYVPRLFAAVDQFTAANLHEPDWDPRYPLALKWLGLVPLLGSALMLVPCLSFMAAPVRSPVRAGLGLLCAAPLVAAGAGARYAPASLTWAFWGLGLLFSLGIWLLALPVVLRNVGLLDLIARLAGGRHRPS